MFTSLHRRIPIWDSWWKHCWKCWWNTFCHQHGQWKDLRIPRRWECQICWCCLRGGWDDNGCTTYRGASCNHVSRSWFFKTKIVHTQSVVFLIMSQVFPIELRRRALWHEKSGSSGCKNHEPKHQFDRNTGSSSSTMFLRMTWKVRQWKSTFQVKCFLWL